MVPYEEIVNISLFWSRAKSINPSAVVSLSAWKDVEYPETKAKKYQQKYLLILEGISIKLRYRYRADIDPIEYIFYLYYQELIGITALARRLNQEFDTNFTKTSMYCLITNYFGWDLRKQGYYSRKTLARQVNYDRYLELVRADHDKLQLSFQKECDNLLGQSQINPEILRALYGSRDKLIYLLFCILGPSATAQNILDFLSYWHNERQISYNTMIIVFRDMIARICPDIELLSNKSLKSALGPIIKQEI